jgi:hypothetical protein
VSTAAFKLLTHTFQCGQHAVRHTWFAVRHERFVVRHIRTGLLSVTAYTLPRMYCVHTFARYLLHSIYVIQYYIRTDYELLRLSPAFCPFTPMLYGKKLSHFCTFFCFRTRKVEKSSWFYFFSSFKKLEKKYASFILLLLSSYFLKYKYIECVAG